MIGVISGIVTLKDKTKSDPFIKQNVRIFSKFVVSFWSFPMALRVGVFTPKGLPALKHGSKMKRDNKSAS